MVTNEQRRIEELERLLQLALDYIDDVNGARNLSTRDKIEAALAARLVDPWAPDGRR